VRLNKAANVEVKGREQTRIDADTDDDDVWGEADETGVGAVVPRVFGGMVSRAR
jgi:hypothetical protein